MLGGFRRTAADRGRGQAAPLRADGLAAILATAARPRTDGRGVESHTTAQRRGRLDAVIASLLFMGGLRRSEVSALEWRDVSDARDGDGVLITVRTSKTNQEGDAADVRYLKNCAAKAIRTLRAADAAPTDRVIGLSPLQIQRRFTAAARAAGIEARLTAHSGRVGLASELTARGASKPKSCWPGTGARRAWSPTTARAPRPNAAPSPSICSGRTAQPQGERDPMLGGVPRTGDILPSLVRPQHRPISRIEERLVAPIRACSTERRAAPVMVRVFAPSTSASLVPAGVDLAEAEARLVSRPRRCPGEDEADISRRG